MHVHVSAFMSDTPEANVIQTSTNLGNVRITNGPIPNEIATEGSYVYEH